MKVIFRADDVGYTNVHNLGTWKAIEDGVVTSCDLMLDTPGFEDACKYLKERPWLSIGWHTHFWGRPVLDPSEVPSMVDEEGKFKWRKDKKAIMEVNYDEALKECRAQLNRCRELLGRIPETCGSGRGPLGEALKTVCDENGIAYDFMGGIGYDRKEKIPAEQYRKLNIKEWIDLSHKHTKSLNVVDFPYYDPAGAIMEMPIEEGTIWMRSQHPGYLDTYVLAESSCTIPRVKDVEALCSPELKQWIIDNKIELINFHDALHGTNQVQDHLKEINSPLWIGNMK